MKYIKLFESFSNKLSIQELESKYKYFHLSWDKYLINDNGSDFTFEPRIPTYPYGFETYTIEDNFTKRISLSDSISNCLSALPDDDYGKWYIYGTKESDFISTKETFKSCPTGYGEKFDLIDWIKSLPKDESDYIIDHIGSEKFNQSGDNIVEGFDVSDLPTKYRDMFHLCVPDANQHNEYWSLKPLTMDYLGYVTSDDVINIFEQEVVYPREGLYR